jgi:hypothetical protein
MLRWRGRRVEFEMKWTKAPPKPPPKARAKVPPAPGDTWLAVVGPLSITVVPRGDGRWAWTIHTNDTPNPTATGLASSLAAAKNVVEQYVLRSGHE